MRLIDADRLIDDLSDLKRSPWANEPWASDQRKLGISEAIDMIQSIIRVDSQTADAVPVIRCKDCKWYGRADKRRFYRGMDCLQNRIATIVPDEDYCSRAERKEE